MNLELQKVFELVKMNIGFYLISRILKKFDKFSDVSFRLINLQKRMDVLTRRHKELDWLFDYSIFVPCAL